MQQQLKLDGNDLELEHVGVVVENMEQTIDFYSKKFGLDFQVAVHDIMLEGIAQGKPDPFKMKVAFTQLGPIKLEIINVIEGESLHTDFLKKRGEGIHHLAFATPDLDKGIADAEALGLKSIFQFKRPVSDIAKVIGVNLESDAEVMIFAYFQNIDPSGLMIELVQHDLPGKIQQAAQ